MTTHPAPSGWDAIREAVVSGADTLALDREAMFELLEVAPLALAVDHDYDARGGFDEAFLGEEVPLPRLVGAAEADAVPITTGARAGDHVLRYHHFSVVLSASRRFARCTGVNIDGRRQLPIDRTSDRWVLDPRLPPEAQIDNRLYKGNPLDRGHLVRRMDACWGDTYAQALAANNDTFHYTNCTPQHEDFNQSAHTWHGLEDYILGRVAGVQLRACVFTGPILAEDDPEFEGVQIPREYWKVVATISEEGLLKASAYLLSQAALIGDLEARRRPPVFGEQQARAFQVPVAQLEAATSLDFGPLRDVDAKAVVSLDAAVTELRELSDVTL